MANGSNGNQQKRTAAGRPQKGGAQARKASGSDAKGSAGAKAQTKGASGARRGSEQAQAGNFYHGAEGMGALVVNLHKTSRLKSKIILGLFILLTASLSWNSVQSWTEPEPRLLGMTTDGRIQELPLLDKPLANRQVLIDWVKRHIPPMYSWNYANFRGELNKNLEIMKPVTLDSFRNMLDQSGILKRVRNDFLILQGRIVDEPLVQNEFVAKGTRVWVVEIPMKLIFDSGEENDNGQRERITQDIIFKAYIARANPMEYPGGLMLAKFDVRNRGQ